jgi:hypothetical protein
MGLDAHDQEVIKLVAKLKEADKEYPPDLLDARRLRYLRRMGEIELGISGTVELKQSAESVNPPASATVNSRLLEIIIVVAIIAEASAVAYFYRDKLVDLVQTITTAAEVQETISPPVNTTQAMPEIIIASPVITFTSLSPTVSVSPADTIITPTRTPSPDIAEETNPATQVDSTSIPNGNNGNHYGQTPKPERTKENNGNGQPPKDNDNKPPKDDPKPIQSK